MADARLVATNPEDSSVVPVACDASGRLLLEEQGQGPQGEQGPQGPKGDDGDPFSGNFADDVTFGGSATFSEKVETVGEEAAVHVGTDKDSNKVPLNIYDTANGNTSLARINGDGSALFAGQLAVGEVVNNSALIIISDDDVNPTLYARNKGTGPVFGGFGSTSNTIPTSRILSDGSATFAGNKAGFTAEGYLWCTTVRGDTVMLDATSNGMGVWVEYTRNTRIDEIRDRLDANRGDTGEMPADTP
jgi:hypothetical protein